MSLIHQSVQHSVEFIPLISTRTTCYMSEPTFFHPLLYGQINNGFILSVIHSGKTGFVRFPIYHLQFLYNISREILRCNFRIIRKKLFTVQQYFLNLFSLSFYLSVFIDLYSGKFFQKILDNRIGLCFKRPGIILHSIFFCDNIRNFSDNNSFFQLYIRRLHHNSPQRDRRVLNRKFY